MSYDHITIHKITSSSVEFYAGEVDGTGNASYTLETSDGATVTTGTSPADGEVTISNLSPGTGYVLYITDEAEETRTSFTTLTNDPKVATEDQWRDLVSRIAKTGMIELTTADYNYPAGNNPTSVATWLLEDGIYHYGKDVTVKPDTMGTLQASGGFVVTLTEENNQDIKKSTFSFGENNFITLWVATESGTRTSLRNIPNLSVINNLTSTSTSDALSANQGRVLKGLVDGKATITMQTTDPGEGATLAANSFIAVYSA